MNIFNLGLSFSGFSIPILTEILIFIDWGIFEIAYGALKGFYKIINLSYGIFGSSETEGYKILNAIIGRIMVLSGIFALFRLSIMLINYLIDPSKIESGTKTGTQIVKNIFIAIVLLLSLNFIFGKLGEFQKVVFENNVIEKIVYGSSFSADDSKEKTYRQFTNRMWLNFFQKTAKAEDNPNNSCVILYNSVASGTGSIKSLIGCHKDYYDYTPIIPFIVGILLIYYFIAYSMELAARMLKLLTLQLLAPIPIIMSIDPSQKNKLSNYIKTYIPIYLQIFVRVIMFYLAFALCEMVMAEGSDNAILNLIGDADWLLKVVIIIGIFQGMKELPNLLKKALGIDLDFNNSYKNYVRGLVGGIGGFAVGTVGGAIAGAASGGLGGMVAGMASGATSGLVGGITAKNWGSTIKNTVGTIGNANKLGSSIKESGGLLPFVGGGITNTFGGKKRDKNTLESFDKSIETSNKQIENINKANDLRNKVETIGKTEFDNKFGSLTDRLASDEDVQKYQEAIEINKQNGFYIQNPEYRAIDEERLANARRTVTDSYNTEKENYFNELISSGNGSYNFKNSLDEYNAFIESTNQGDKKINNYSDIGRLNSESEKEIYNEETKKRQAESDKSKFENSPGRRARKVQGSYAEEQKKKK